MLITLLAVRRQNYESAALRNWDEIIYKAPLADAFVIHDRSTAPQPDANCSESMRDETVVPGENPRIPKNTGVELRSFRLIPRT